MLVLGIESSCDETAAAVVADGERIRSSVVASQVLMHEKYGGVVPELASREHLRAIEPVVDEACRQAEVTLHDVDAIAVTEGPGLGRLAAGGAGLRQGPGVSPEQTPGRRQSPGRPHPRRAAGK